jgi:hypothetical protein
MFAAALTAAALSGCTDDVVCADGTHLENNECKASLSPQCGDGTVLQNGACVPDNGGGAVCGLGTHIEDGTCVADVGFSGNAARFYDVSLRTPAAFVNLAQGPLAEAFRTGENLLFVGAYAPVEGEVRVFGGGGTRNTNGWFALDRGTSFDAAVTFDGDEFTSDRFTIPFNAFGSSTPIVLVNTIISHGKVSSPEGVELVDSGHLAGVMTPEAADAVYIETANQTLLVLTQGLHIAPDVDNDGDGVAESWLVSLDFATTPVWLF